MKIHSAYAGMDSAGSRASVTQTKACVLTADIGSAHGWDDEGSRSFSQLLNDAGEKIGKWTATYLHDFTLKENDTHIKISAGKKWQPSNSTRNMIGMKKIYAASFYTK